MEWKKVNEESIKKIYNSVLIWTGDYFEKAFLKIDRYDENQKPIYLWDTENGCISFDDATHFLEIEKPKN